MSIEPCDRRRFLTLLVALALTPRPTTVLAAPPLTRYLVEVDILYGALAFRLPGRIAEDVDDSAGRYHVVAEGHAEGIANRIESEGMLRGGRWTPLRSSSWFEVYGRQSRTSIAYDHDRRTVEYRARGETFFLRRLRVVDDRVALPAEHVDDAVSALLNFRDRRWVPGPDGRLRTQVVRRRRADDEGPDDVARAYRAEVVPLELSVVPDAGSKVTVLFDLSRFSSWARGGRPARIVFGVDRDPELITSSMILGTSFTARLG